MLYTMYYVIELIKTCIYNLCAIYVEKCHRKVQKSERLLNGVEHDEDLCSLLGLRSVMLFMPLAFGLSSYTVLENWDRDEGNGYPCKLHTCETFHTS